MTMVYAVVMKQKLSNGNTRIEFHPTVHDDSPSSILSEADDDHRESLRAPCGKGVFSTPSRELIEMILGDTSLPRFINGFAWEHEVA